MDAENQTSLRRLLVRMAATLVALAVLYVLGAGPASYAYMHYPQSRRLYAELYRPLNMAAADTPMEIPLFAYEEWCMTFVVYGAGH